MIDLKEIRKKPMQTLCIKLNQRDVNFSPNLRIIYNEHVDQLNARLF